MGKTKPADRSSCRSRQRDRKSRTHKTEQEKRTSEDLLREAAELFQQSQPDLALPPAQRALSRLRKFQNDSESQVILPALVLVAQILLELGDPEAAREHFLAAITIDPAGEKIGADPFLWLAQLSEEGGKDSIEWFEQGIAVLKRELSILEVATGEADQLQSAVQEKKQKVSDALCSMVEVYMTDLSFDPEAESMCESLITEALLLSSDSPSTLQTLASVRISQVKVDEARTALSRSMDLWRDLPPEHLGIPDFPSRISLSRLLMEVEMEPEAQRVLEVLVQEDDQSVEAWYLGGWCQYLQAQKTGESAAKAREWLGHSLRLYSLQDYEDERLRDHARELVSAMDAQLGGSVDEEEEWQDESEVEDGDIEIEETTSSLPMR